MTGEQTFIASMKTVRPGGLFLPNDDPEHYAFSNLYDVARESRSFERVAVVKNLQYVVEVMKVEGESPWYAASHDEFALVMEGTVTFSFVELAEGDKVAQAEEGAHRLPARPNGAFVGTVKAGLGNLVLLPTQTAYRLASPSPAVVIFQTIAGPETLERWREICSSRYVHSTPAD